MNKQFTIGVFAALFAAFALIRYVVGQVKRGNWPLSSPPWREFRMRSGV